MKKLLYTLIAMLTIAGTALLTSCSKDDDKDNDTALTQDQYASAIKGTWGNTWENVKGTDSGSTSWSGSYYYEFLSTGTETIIFNGTNGSYKYTETRTYTNVTKNPDTYETEYTFNYTIYDEKDTWGDNEKWLKLTINSVTKGSNYKVGDIKYVQILGMTNNTVHFNINNSAFEDDEYTRK